MRAYQYFTVLVSLLVVAGCGMEGPAPSDEKTATPAAPAATPSSATAAAPTAAPARPTAEAPSVAAADAKPTVAAPKPSGTLKEAQVGMGEKGRGYGGGLIAVSVTSLWATRERVALMQMQQALEMYKGEHGYYPKTQAEFDEKIIKENNIRRPQLPVGQTYEYDPQEAKLMVRMPAADAPNGP